MPQIVDFRVCSRVCLVCFVMPHRIFGTSVTPNFRETCAETRPNSVKTRPKSVSKIRPAVVDSCSLNVHWNWWVSILKMVLKMMNLYWKCFKNGWTWYWQSARSQAPSAATIHHFQCKVHHFQCQCHHFYQRHPPKIKSRVSIFLFLEWKMMDSVLKLMGLPSRKWPRPRHQRAQTQPNHKIHHFECKFHHV